MDRKKEISLDIWEIMRQVYDINPVSKQSEKQEQFIQKVVEYLDANISIRRKKQDTKDKS